MPDGQACDESQQSLHRALLPMAISSAIRFARRGIWSPGCGRMATIWIGIAAEALVSWFPGSGMHWPPRGGTGQRQRERLPLRVEEWR